MTESDFLLTQRVAANLAASAEAHHRRIAEAMAVLVLIGSIARIVVH